MDHRRQKCAGQRGQKNHGFPSPSRAPQAGHAREKGKHSQSRQKFETGRVLHHLERFVQIPMELFTRSPGERRKGAAPVRKQVAFAAHRAGCDLVAEAPARQPKATDNSPGHCLFPFSAEYRASKEQRSRSRKDEHRRVRKPYRNHSCRPSQEVPQLGPRISSRSEHNHPEQACHGGIR